MFNTSVLAQLNKQDEELEVGISFKVKESFRTKANISAQVLKKSVTQICIDALEQAIAEAGLSG